MKTTDNTTNIEIPERKQLSNLPFAILLFLFTSGLDFRTGDEEGSCGDVSPYSVCSRDR